MKLLNIAVIPVLAASQFVISYTAFSRDGLNEPAVSLAKGKILAAVEKVNAQDSKIEINIQSDDSLLPQSIKKAEGFSLSINKDKISINAFDTGGAVYAGELAAQTISESDGIPEDFQVEEAPVLRWRGISLQLMKLGQYNYAITPEEFPFFYDKELWLMFLDFLVEKRFNYIVLWNGHPFDYFVKFEQFPEAQSGMTGAQIDQNYNMLKWITSEGQKRNIKILFEFYNIHTSVYFQEAHNLPRESSKPTKLLEEYTAYSIGKFVSEFPEVGLFITPGEGLDIQYSEDWIKNVLFKAVKNTGHTPIIFMRGWTYELEYARKIVNYYPDLHFVRKFNVEMIAGTRVDPENKEWAKLNGNFIVNIHLSANLEPFRWNPPSYIEQIVRNNIESGANGIHIHPRKAWRWPYGSDTGEKQFQWDRDELWFTAWSRYSWNPDRNQSEEEKYWLNLLIERYGSERAARHFLNSFETGADVLPALQRLFWIGHDNHTIVTMGATLSQLAASKGIPFLPLEDTLRISEFLEILKKDPDYSGDSPLDFLTGIIQIAENSLNEARKGLKLTKRNKEEAKRITIDAEAVLLSAKYYYFKLKALTAKTFFDEGVEPEKNKSLFIEDLTQSVAVFKSLAEVTSKTYITASDVPARHPIRLKKNPYHWKDVLPIYEDELNFYKVEVAKEKSEDYYKPLREGLTGILYGDPGYVGPDEQIPAPTIDFDWNGQEEGHGRHWSAKWFGYLKGPREGKVKFYISSDRDVETMIDETTIRFNAGAGSHDVNGVMLEKNKFYLFEVRYDHEGGEGGFLKIEWSWEGHPREVVPKDYFKHSQAQHAKFTP